MVLAWAKKVVNLVPLCGVCRRLEPVLGPGEETFLDADLLTNRKICEKVRLKDLLPVWRCCFRVLNGLNSLRELIPCGKF